jgi:hypothetical protein
MRRWSWIAMMAVMLAARGAHAEDPPEQTAADDERLQRVLETAASQGRNGRITAAVVDATVAAVVTPPGVILVTRGDPGLQIVGVTLLIRGGWDLYSMAFTALPSSMETLRAHYDKRKAQGDAPAAVIAETELEWQDAIRHARHIRPIYGVLDLVLGTAETAAGMYLLLANPGAFGWDRQQQTTGVPSSSGSPCLESLRASGTCLALPGQRTGGRSTKAPSRVFPRPLQQVPRLHLCPLRTGPSEWCGSRSDIAPRAALRAPWRRGLGTSAETRGSQNASPPGVSLIPLCPATVRCSEISTDVRFVSHRGMPTAANTAPMLREAMPLGSRAPGV